VRRAANGSVGAAQMALCEVLARDPRYAIDVVSTIEKLDEQGLHPKVVVRGFELETDERIFAESDRASGRRRRARSDLLILPTQRIPSEPIIRS
jgi:hypothetical protein